MTLPAWTQSHVLMRPVGTQAPTINSSQQNNEHKSPLYDNDS